MCRRTRGPFMQVDAARLLLDRAVAEADTAENGLPSMLSSSMAKCYANEIAVEVRARVDRAWRVPDAHERCEPSGRFGGCTRRQVVSTAMQLLGGYGYATSFPMERRMRDVLGWRVAGGRPCV